jgi:hypothetical protein
MKKIVSYFLSALLLINLVGCNESKSSESSNSETIKVSLSIPSTQGSTKEGKKQFKSFQSDVDSVLLKVYKSARDTDDAVLLSTKAMTKNATTGVWTIDLVLNPDDAPFDFQAMAYEGEVTVETAGDNTPIFTGTASDKTGNTVIALTETEDSINDSIKKLPTLSSVDTVVNSNDSIALTFNVAYANGGSVGYALSSVADDGEGTECSTSLFTPTTGSVDFTSATENTFVSSLSLDSANCASPKHFLKMTTSNGDTIKIPFIVDANSLAVNIGLPPVIENINVLDNGTSFDLDVVVTDSDTLTLSYAWSVVEGAGTSFDDATAQSTNLSGFDRANALEVLIAVTNTTTSAVSSIRYELIASSTPLSTVKATGQTKSYNTAGVEVGNDEIGNGSVKDDGFYQAGLASSYTRNASDETVTDNVTGLIWQDDIDAKTITKNYADAITYCSDKGEDWTLPTLRQLQGLIDFSKTTDGILDTEFVNYASKRYWSSTTHATNTNSAWYVHFDDGRQSSNTKSLNYYSVRCVRAGQ